MSVNMSVSNQPYSSINGMTSNSIKSLFVTEGESLVSDIINRNSLVVLATVKNSGMKCEEQTLERKVC